MALALIQKRCIKNLSIFKIYTFLSLLIFLYPQIQVNKKKSNQNFAQKLIIQLVDCCRIVFFSFSNRCVLFSGSFFLLFDLLLNKKKITTTKKIYVAAFFKI